MYNFSRQPGHKPGFLMVYIILDYIISSHIAISFRSVAPCLQVVPGVPRFQGNQSLQEVHRILANQAHPAEGTNNPGSV